MFKELLKLLFPSKEQIDANKVTVEEIVAVIEPDMRQTIDMLQHLVNTVTGITNNHGHIVGEWTLTDMDKITECFSRMGRV